MDGERLFDTTGADIWDRKLVVPSIEFDVMGVITEEARTQALLDQDHVENETAEEFLVRYREAREIVGATPLPDDFDEGEALESFQDAVIDTLQN